ncbi:asparagine synthetase B family protein [Sphingomonas sp.]|uniref:asparagine synthetase B family protein n=1 Tax=Sphingomonas sp. TaxID=28214 RepID=UPI003D6D6CDF
MGEFAGIVRFDGGQIDGGTFERLGRGLVGQLKATLWHGGAGAIAERPALKAASHLLPQMGELASGALLVADARLDERDNCIAALGIDPLRRPDDLEILGAACERWRDDAAARLYGEFAFALWDERSRRLTLARDALGMRSLYYFADGNMAVFATTLRKMLALPQVPRDLDDIALGNFLTQTQGDVERTLYSHIKRVPPGGTIVIERGSVRANRYWVPQSIPTIGYSHDQDYVEAARELLDRAVASRLPPEGGVTAMLSGGFDSTGVVGTAARLLGDRRIHAFTRVPGAAHPYNTLDEAALARQLVDCHPNIDWTTIDDDVETPRDRAPELEAPILCMPRTGAFNPAWFRPLLDAVERTGARVLLNGGMGNMTLSWAGKPPYADHLRRGRLIAAARVAFDTRRSQKRSLFDVLRKDFAPVMEPRHLRLWRWRRRDGGAPAILRHCAVSRDFLDSLNSLRYAWALDQELPFQMTGDARTWRMSLLQTQESRDVMAGIRHFFSFEQRDPMSDRRLAEFTLGVPDDQFFHKGETRWLARRVLADRVPRDVLIEHRQGRQCPEWHHVAKRRRDAMAASIERIGRSSLASRVIDVPRLKTLLDTFPDDAATAMKSSAEHGPMLLRGIQMGSFLRWHEGGNE